MLTDIRIYASDTIWRQILADFGATVLSAPSSTDVNFDEFGEIGTVTSMELKSLILNATDAGRIVKEVLGEKATLPRIQAQLVALLYKSGGMTTSELKAALGYAPNATTHTVDTVIYQLRRIYGRGFIQNINGVYSLGKL